MNIEKELDRIENFIQRGRPGPEGTTWRGVAASAAWGFFLAGVFLYVAVVSGALD